VYCIVEQYYVLTYLWILQELDKVSTSFLLVCRVFGEVTAGLSKEPNGCLFDGFAECGSDHKVVLRPSRRAVDLFDNVASGRIRSRFRSRFRSELTHEDLAGQFQVLLRRSGRSGNCHGRRRTSSLGGVGRKSPDAASSNTEESDQCGGNEFHCQGQDVFTSSSLKR
jgi:hypothetical protein